MTELSRELKQAMGGSWTIGVEGFLGVVAELAAQPAAPRRILEFGSGASTLGLLEVFPDATVVSVEHDLTYQPAIRMCDRSRSQIIESRLGWRKICGVMCDTYMYNPEGQFDAALVDGPPGNRANGRLGAMLIAYQSLRPGGVLILDDAHRPAEMRWAADFTVMTGEPPRFVEAGHGLFVFRKREGGQGVRVSRGANARFAVATVSKALRGLRR